VCRNSLYGGGVASRGSLRGYGGFCGAAASSDFEANQKCAFLIGGRILRRGFQKRTSACSRVIAGLLANRTSQAEKAYPSVPEAVATFAAAGVPATDLSGCTE
jgi:hypothetical protein